VDRLINELKLGPEDMMKRFVKIITEVNRLLKRYAPEEFKEAWQVNVENGSVILVQHSITGPFQPNTLRDHRLVSRKYISISPQEIRKLSRRRVHCTRCC